MRFAFERLPGTGVDVPRAALEVVVTGTDQSLSALCLIDTGSLHNRFGAWVADLAGIDLAATDTQRIGVGGTITEARTVTCELRLGDVTWEAPVAFCDPWPFDFHLLGQLGFLRWFRVVIDAADEAFEVIPNIA
ncbi:MAG: retropepsin-like domain-containing protein [Actinomycetota bacterium]|nr:retropepsin-like domain-containing protein [Actinomycetota bacterium]